MMKTSRLSATLITRFVTLLAILASSSNCWAVIVYFNGSTSTDFLNGTNWTPAGVPGNNLVDIYSIDDGLNSMFSGGTTTVKGLRVGSAAKEHAFGETHFGRLTMTGGSLEVIGNNTLAVGRENLINYDAPVGADYNQDTVVDAADYVIWRNTLGSMIDLSADGDGSGTIGAPDYDIWRAGYGNRVNGGEIIMTGSSTLKAYGALIGERTIGLLSIGPVAVVDIRIWDTAVMPNQFGGSEDMRIGGYGPSYAAENFEPGLDGRGLVNVQGTLNAKDLYVSEHGAKGEIQLSGGTVNLNGELIMNFCGACGADPGLLALRSAKVSIVGSSGSFKVGLDPDPMVVDPSLTLKRDIKANSPTAIFSFTADAGGVAPIIVVDNSISSEISGFANIAGAKLELNLDAYTSTSPLTLINAANGHHSGTFGAVTFLGSRTATVNYDVFNGNVFLSNFLGGAGMGSLASAAVPEPSGLLMMTLALGLLLFSFSARAKRQPARSWG